MCLSLQEKGKFAKFVYTTDNRKKKVYRIYKETYQDTFKKKRRKRLGEFYVTWLNPWLNVETMGEG